jgi:dTMP kinase
MPGCLITFEGSEGVGKSTQIKYLETALISQAYDVVITREPGGTPAAEKIRELLSDPQFGGKWCGHAELLLMFVARAEHIKDVIVPALKKNKIILCDRYVDSTRVYQGHLANIPMDFILDLEKRIVGNVMPHLTFILDMPAQEAMARVRTRGVKDHYDQGDETIFQTLRDGFLAVGKDEKRCHIVDAMQNEEVVAADILTRVKDHLDEHV